MKEMRNLIFDYGYCMVVNAENLLIYSQNIPWDREIEGFHKPRQYLQEK